MMFEPSVTDTSGLDLLPGFEYSLDFDGPLNPSPPSLWDASKYTLADHEPDFLPGLPQVKLEEVPAPTNVVPEPAAVQQEQQTERPKARKRKARSAPGPDGRQVHRRFHTYPEELMDPAQTGLLSMSTVPAEIQQRILREAQQKVQEVRSGARKFGRPMFLPSFQEPENLSFEMPSTLPAILLMHALFSDQVMYTEFGKVSFAPCTMYRTKQDHASERNGYPVVALFRPHLTSVVTRMFSAARQAVDRSTLSRYFHHAECKFHWSEDSALVTLMGVEPFNHKYQRKDHGFFLMSAHWLDVMKCFFLHEDLQRRNVGDIFRSVFPKWRHKFTPEFRVIWLGDERDVSVSDILKECGQEHTKSMTRARAANGEIRFGKEGPLWALPVCGSIKDQLSSYDQHSLVYGAQCWEHTLTWLNTAFEFFTGTTLPKDSSGRTRPVHMRGLLFVDPEVPVVDRTTSIANGLHADSAKKTVSDAIRAARRKIADRYGGNFSANFFGNNFKVCYKK
jgi:hypothetical protein